MTQKHYISTSMIARGLHTSALQGTGYTQYIFRNSVFRDYLYAALQVCYKYRSGLKGNFFTKTSKFFPFRVDPLSERQQTELTNMKVYSFHLSYS